MSLQDRIEAFLSHRTGPDALLTAARASTDPDASLWAGVARLEAGDDAAAAGLLRAWLDDPSDAAGGVDASRRTTATVLLMVAESGLVDAVRGAVHLCGSRWLEHCPLPLDRVLVEVAAADPALLVPVVAGLPDTARPGPAARARAAAALLGLALAAEHAGLAAARLAQAEWLLEGDPDVA